MEPMVSRVALVCFFLPLFRIPTFNVSHSSPLSFHILFIPAASLGINGTKSTYIPPHLRNSQRAAPTPTTNEYVHLFKRS